MFFIKWAFSSFETFICTFSGFIHDYWPCPVMYMPSLPFNTLWMKPSLQFSSFQFSSITQSCPPLCDPMDCSTPGLPVHHQLPEFTQTHVHWVDDAIQPSHPLSFLFSPALNSVPESGSFLVKLSLTHFLVAMVHGRRLMMIVEWKDNYLTSSIPGYGPQWFNNSF